MRRRLSFTNLDPANPNITCRQRSRPRSPSSPSSPSSSSSPSSPVYISPYMSYAGAILPGDPHYSTLCNKCPASPRSDSNSPTEKEKNRNCGARTKPLLSPRRVNPPPILTDSGYAREMNRMISQGALPKRFQTRNVPIVSGVSPKPAILTESDYAREMNRLVAQGVLPQTYQVENDPIVSAPKPPILTESDYAQAMNRLVTQGALPTTSQVGNDPQVSGPKPPIVTEADYAREMNRLVAQGVLPKTSLVRNSPIVSGPKHPITTESDYAREMNRLIAQGALPETFQRNVPQPQTAPQYFAQNNPPILSPATQSDSFSLGSDPNSPPQLELNQFGDSDLAPSVAEIVADITSGNVPALEGHAADFLAELALNSRINQAQPPASNLPAAAINTSLGALNNTIYKAPAINTSLGVLNNTIYKAPAINTSLGVLNNTIYKAPPSPARPVPHGTTLGGVQDVRNMRDRIMERARQYEQEKNISLQGSGGGQFIPEDMNSIIKNFQTIQNGIAELQKHRDQHMAEQQSQLDQQKHSQQRGRHEIQNPVEVTAGEAQDMRNISDMVRDQSQIHNISVQSSQLLPDQRSSGRRSAIRAFVSDLQSYYDIRDKLIKRIRKFEQIMQNSKSVDSNRTPTQTSRCTCDCSIHRPGPDLNKSFNVTVKSSSDLNIHNPNINQAQRRGCGCPITGTAQTAVDETFIIPSQHVAPACHHYAHGCPASNRRILQRSANEETGPGAFRRSMAAQLTEMKKELLPEINAIESMEKSAMKSNLKKWQVERRRLLLNMPNVKFHNSHPLT